MEAGSGAEGGSAPTAGGRHGEESTPGNGGDDAASGSAGTEESGGSAGASVGGTAGEGTVAHRGGDAGAGGVPGTGGQAGADVGGDNGVAGRADGGEGSPAAGRGGGASGASAGSSAGGSAGHGASPPEGGKGGGSPLSSLGGSAGGGGGDCLILDEEPQFARELGCTEDFLALASEPLTAAIPGARSAKTVVDRLDGNALYFQNNQLYPIHYDFAAAHLSGNGLPMVPTLSEFNLTEYGSPDRRFILGALTFYEGPGIWAYEIAPYDTADADLITAAYRLIQAQTFLGERLVFHPTSDNVSREAENLLDDIPIVTTEELLADTDYQPVSLARVLGRLTFRSAADLQTSPVGFRDVVVLDEVTPELSASLGLITDGFLPPLSNLALLIQDRGTAAMGLRGAFSNEDLRALEGRWIALDVGPFSWSIVEVSQAQADAWWEEQRLLPEAPPALDLGPRELVFVEDLLDLEHQELVQALEATIPAYGGKASHFAALPHFSAPHFLYPAAFAVPVAHYWDFMEANGFFARLLELQADPEFSSDAAVRKQRLETLQAEMLAAPVEEAFAAELGGMVEDHFALTPVKFRASSNCEDLTGFTGAGLYASAAAQIGDPARPVLDAVRTVWASTWGFRAYEEREYRGIPHDQVGMALLVSRAFPEEEANGVAITANPFDTRAVEPGFYVNVQVGDDPVTVAQPGVTPDQFILHYDMSGQPSVALGRSSLLATGSTVLTRSQSNELGEALTAIHAFFNPVYGPNTLDHFYAMEVEFKLDDGPDGATALFVKQVRPYSGRGR